MTSPKITKNLYNFLKYVNEPVKDFSRILTREERHLMNAHKCIEWLWKTYSVYGNSFVLRILSETILLNLSLASCIISLEQVDCFRLPTQENKRIKNTVRVSPSTKNKI